MLGIARKTGANPNLFNTARVDRRGHLLINNLIGGDNFFARLGICHRIKRSTSEHTLTKRDLDFVTLDNSLDFYAVNGIAVLGRDDDILRDVNEFTREVTSVCRLKRGFSKTLTCTVG